MKIQNAFQNKINFFALSVILGYQQHHPISPDYSQGLQLKQHWSSSHFQMSLFTEYNKEKIYSKQTRTIKPIYIVGISQSQLELIIFF